LVYSSYSTVQLKRRAKACKLGERRLIGSDSSTCASVSMNSDQFRTRSTGGLSATAYDEYMPNRIVRYATMYFMIIPLEEAIRGVANIRQPCRLARTLSDAACLALPPAGVKPKIAVPAVRTGVESEATVRERQNDNVAGLSLSQEFQYPFLTSERAYRALCSWKRQSTALLC